MREKSQNALHLRNYIDLTISSCSESTEEHDYDAT